MQIILTEEEYNQLKDSAAKAKLVDQTKVDLKRALVPILKDTQMRIRSGLFYGDQCDFDREFAKMVRLISEL